jgi:hypothetical protein
MAESERQAADVDDRLQEIDAQTSTLRDQSIDLDGVTAALEEFEAVCGVLHSGERSTLVRSMVKTVTCDCGKARIEFRMHKPSRTASQ